MKNNLFIIATLALFVSSPSFAYDDHCQRKEEALNKQLEYAKRYNNQNKLRGVTRGLKKVKQYCRDDTDYHRKNNHHRKNFNQS